MLSLKKIALSAFAVAMLTGMVGCIKDDEFFDDNDGDESAPSIVKIMGADQDIVVYARDVTPAIDTFALIDLRRDVHGPSKLNEPLTVKLELHPTLISDYNAANGTNFIPLPASSYTLLGDLNNITFAPGESAKQIAIRVDKSQLNLSSQYALGFKITSVSGGGIISTEMRNVLYSIGIKNAYDGRYRLRFGFYHPSLSPTYGTAVTDVELHTSGPNSVKIFWPAAGGYAHPILNGSALSYFAAQEPNFTIGTGNSVTVQNSFPGAVTFYTMAQGYNSRYEPGTRTIYAKFGYNYSAGAFNPSTTREWTDTLIYLGPR
jgi:hypothetical protein